MLTSRNSLGPLRALLARQNPDLMASGEGGSNLTLVRVPGRLGGIAERRELAIHEGEPERRSMALTRTASGLCVANLHATNDLPELAGEDVLHAARAAGEFAGDAPLIFGGDLNLRPAEDPEVFERLREDFGLAAADRAAGDRPPADAGPRGARRRRPPGRRSGASCRSTGGRCGSPITHRSRRDSARKSHQCCGIDIVDQHTAAQKNFTPWRQVEMAEKKAAAKTSKKAKKAPARAASKAKAKAKKAAPRKASAKTSAKKSSSKKATAKRAAKKSTPKRASSKATSGLDKSVAQFRESLEQSVTLSRDRLQEVVDDAVKRGRMTRGDAEKMLSDLVKRGRKQTDSLLGELERLVKQARKEVGGRAEPVRAVRKQATQAARRARKKLG